MRLTDLGYISRARLALADWDAFLTTAPADRLSGAEALTLVWAGWQVEMLCKLWQSPGAHRRVAQRPALAHPV